MDPTQHSLNSEFQIDQIIGVVDSKDTGAINVGAGANASVTIPLPNIKKQCLFEGYFRVQSVGLDTPLGGKSFTGAGTIPTDRGVYVWVKTSPGSVTILASNSELSSQVVDYKIILIASTEQDPVDPPVLKDPISFASDFNYLKIAKQGILPLTTGASFSRAQASIEHKLGYKPLHKVWYEYGNEIQRSGASNNGLMPGLIIGVAPSVDNNKLYFDVWNNTGHPARDIRLHYRVYYDY